MIGMEAERTKVGRALTSPVCAMLAAAALVNVGVLPSHSQVLGDIQRPIASLATPLMLLSANLRKITAGAGRGMLLSFAIAATSACLGGISAFAALSGLGFQLDWRLCSALLAKNIGGGLNYIAICGTLGVSSDLIAIGLTVDNIVGLVYFPLMSVAASLFDQSEAVAETERLEATQEPAPAPYRDTAKQLMIAFAFAFCTIAVARFIAEHFLAGATLPAATVLTTAVVTFFPSLIDRFRPGGESLGKALLFIYFASAGAGGGTVLSAAGYLPLLFFCCIMYAVHVAIVLLSVKLLNRRVDEAFLASNASIGGPATASAMAMVRGAVLTILAPALSEADRMS